MRTRTRRTPAPLRPAGLERSGACCGWALTTGSLISVALLKVMANGDWRFGDLGVGFRLTYARTRVEIY